VGDYVIDRVQPDREAPIYPKIWICGSLYPLILVEKNTRNMRKDADPSELISIGKADAKLVDDARSGSIWQGIKEYDFKCVEPLVKPHEHYGYESRVVHSFADEHFVYQFEALTVSVTAPKCMLSEAVYTKDGHYVGTISTAQMLLDRGITEQIQPAEETHTICSIGFNPTEQKWYGWSHRAICGFGIGSEVKSGDCAYKATDAADLEEWAKSFWQIGKVRECETPDKHCTTVLRCVTHGVRRDESEMPGMLMETYTEFDFDREGFASEHFHPYPETWGPGEWKAETLEDAKQMAIDFAFGVH
jgi:hypothetical protein